MHAESAGAANTVFLPTKCMALLEALCAARPAHCLLAADFDALPDTAMPGKNAPLVATTVSSAATAHMPTQDPSMLVLQWPQHLDFEATRVPGNMDDANINLVRGIYAWHMSRWMARRWITAPICFR